MRLFLAAALLCVAAPAIGAQRTAGLVPCRGQRIDSITIDAQAPTVAGLRRVPVVGNIARETHVITRDQVIRGFLLLHVGQRCSELRRAESERILRAQPFLADATIDVLGNDRGGVDLDVKTIDDVSLVLSGALGGQSPAVRSVKFGSANLAGLGVLTTVSWRYERALDDRLELRASDYQFAGRPYVLSLVTVHDPLGRDDHAEMTLPFRTDVQRYAWRTLIGESRGHAQFIPRDSGRLTLGFGREYAEVGAIGRLGPPGKLTLFGLSVSDERSRPDTAAEILDIDGLHPDTASGFDGRFVETKAARVNALIGLRGIRFMRARGFDALRGTQDVPIGLQFGALVGRGIHAFGANSSDLFVASDLYIGMGSPRITYRLQMQGEGRRVLGGKQWESMVGSGRLARYSRPTDNRTQIISAELSGTHRVRVPHSLSLNIADGGMRGYREALEVAARRAILRIDEQQYLGSPFSFGDLGIGLFADAGRLWAGDLPYGQTTPIRASAGLSMLLAIPMRSTRMWRLEFAVPMNRIPEGNHWELRLSHADRTSFFWREPADVDAARARAVPASIYNWP